MASTDPDIEPLWREFHDLVNMNSHALRDWLAASEEVFGQVAPGVPREEPDGDLPTLGWRVVEILGKRKRDLTADDTAVMQRVIEIIQGRLKNRPSNRIDSDEWRRDLMLLGHDPLTA
jgi:hypothetical protein